MQLSKRVKGRGLNGAHPFKIMQLSKMFDKNTHSPSHGKTIEYVHVFSTNKLFNN